MYLVFRTVPTDRGRGHAQSMSGLWSETVGHRVIRKQICNALSNLKQPWSLEVTQPREAKQRKYRDCVDC